MLSEQTLCFVVDSEDEKDDDEVREKVYGGGDSCASRDDAGEKRANGITGMTDGCCSRCDGRLDIDTRELMTEVD